MLVSASLSMSINMSVMVELRWPNMASAAATIVRFMAMGVTTASAACLLLDVLTLEVTDMDTEPVGVDLGTARGDVAGVAGEWLLVLTVDDGAVVGSEGRTHVLLWLSSGGAVGGTRLLEVLLLDEVDMCTGICLGWYVVIVDAVVVDEDGADVEVVSGTVARAAFCALVVGEVVNS